MNTLKLTIKTNIDEKGNIIDDDDVPVYKKISQIEAEMMNIDEKTPSTARSSPANQEDVLNPMRQICAKMEEMRIDIKKEKPWCKQAPGPEYTGKRTSKGMPDKRTKAGKEWYASVLV